MSVGGIPEEVRIIASRLQLGAFKGAQAGAGQRYYEYANGTVKGHIDAAASIDNFVFDTVRARSHGVDVFLPAAVVELAAADHLGAFTGESRANGRVTYTFDHGSIGGTGNPMSPSFRIDSVRLGP
jgi:hypothetical protein